MKTRLKKKIILVKYQAKKQRHMARIQVALQTGLAAATLARIQGRHVHKYQPGATCPAMQAKTIPGHILPEQLLQDLENTQDLAQRMEIQRRLDVAQEIMEHATASVRILGSAQEWEGWAIGKLFIKIRGKHHRKPKNIFNTHFSLSHCHKIKKARVKPLKISSYNL